MYSLVIADDEQNICKAISTIVKSICPNIKIAAVYNSGEELLDFLKNGHCDIIVSDIQMGGISGIDIAEYLYSNNRDTQLILITGYRIFEYAHKAIEYNVSSFLTKPFSSSDLANALKNAEEKIEHIIRESIHYNKSMLADWHILRQNVKSVFGGEYSKNKFPAESYEYFNFSDCKVYEIHYYLEDDIHQFDNLLDKAKNMGEYSSEETLCIFADINENALCFVAFARKALEIHIINDFLNGMNLMYNCQLSGNYEEFENTNQYILYCRCRKIFDSILNFSFDNSEADTLIFIKNTVNSLNSNESEYLRKYIISKFQKSDADAILTIDRSKDIIFLLSQICQLLKIDSIQLSLTQKVKQYIIDEYSNYNISLKSVAEHFSITPEYLSKIFKSEEQIGFKAFLQKMRIDKAKDLLVNSKITIDEIAFSVGYSSSSHFKHLFKELTGVSPTEYRKNQIG